MSAEEAAVSYNYTAPLVMLAGLGAAALVLGLVLKVINKRQNLGLEDPNIKPSAEVLESEAASLGDE